MSTVTNLPQILITQSQAAADAASSLLGLPAHAAPGFDWPSLAGRRVILWPTNTALSIHAFRANLAACWSHGAVQVKAITLGPLDHAGWDAAAAQREGWDRETLLGWLREHAEECEAPEGEEAAEAEEPALPQVDEPQFEPVPPPEPSVPDRSGWAACLSWIDKWEYLGIQHFKGKPITNLSSVIKVLERHPNFADIVWYDEFLQRVLRVDIQTKKPREWEDRDDSDLLNFLQDGVGLASLKVQDVRLALKSVTGRRRRNCAQDWIKAQTWDGTERIASFFVDVFECENTAYARAVGRNFWISMVARIFKPGCKVDNMVVLEGSQGFGKSSLLEEIGGDWFVAQAEPAHSKAFFENLQGKCLVEIAEMDSFNRSEVTKVKQVITTRTDRFRDAFGHNSRDHDRTSIFVGTTNKDDWNRDETGARRFWPIRCHGRADVEAVRGIRGQLFAEALHNYRLGKTVAAGRWWETPEEETLQQQEERREDDSWLAPVGDWLSDIYRTRVTVGEALWEAVKMPLADQHTSQQKRMGAVLHRLGWRKKHTAKGNVWLRPGNEPS